MAARSLTELFVKKVRTLDQADHRNMYFDDTDPDVPSSEEQFLCEVSLDSEE